MLLPKTGVYLNSYFYRALLFAVAILGCLASIYVGIKVHESDKQHLVNRVNTLAQVIDPEYVRFLAGDETDLERAPYQALKSRLTSIRLVNPDVRFLYLAGLKEDGEMFFYVDSEDPTSEDYSPPGELYPEATPLMFDIFAGTQNAFELSRDHWGLWISAYAPLRDQQTGEVVALVGIDAPGTLYILDMIVYSALPILIAFVLIVLLAGLHYLIEHERRYIDQKSEFVSIASHELRTPLVGIRWATEQLLSQKDNKLPVAIRGTILLIHENCFELINHVNNLLGASALDHKRKFHMNMATVNLRPTIDQIIRSLELTAAAQNIKIVVDPSLPAEITAHCDAEQIMHVLTNLISNAIKYTHPNTNVTINYRQENEKHRISVTDQGQGISSEDQKLVFRGYHRTESAKESAQPGTGLGLYLARKIALLHKGNIEIDSAEGKGSTFTLVLPVQK